MNVLRVTLAINKEPIHEIEIVNAGPVTLSPEYCVYGVTLDGDAIGRVNHFREDGALALLKRALEEIEYRREYDIV